MIFCLVLIAFTVQTAFAINTPNSGGMDITEDVIDKLVFPSSYITNKTVD